MPTTLQILHSSDFEAGTPAIDDAVRFSAILNYFKTATTGTYAVSPTVLANTLTLSSGDNSIPGPFLYASSDPSLNGIGGLGTSTSPLIGRADVAILNEFGIQASVVGNHDLDLGVRQFGDALRLGSGSPGANFPYLSSNLDFNPEIATGNLRATDLATNQATAEASTIKGKLAESSVITVAGADGIAGTADDQKIGIVGATTPTLRQITSSGQITVLPANPVDYVALAAEIQKSVDALTATGINKVILLAHMQQFNIERDELAPRLKDVDIIIAGGSHTLLTDANDTLRASDASGGAYPITRTSATGQPLLVINSAANYEYVPRLVVTFDDNGIIDPTSLNSTLNGSFATDEAGVDRVYGSDVNPREKANANVVAITDGLRRVISDKDNLTTGKTTFFLNGDRNFVRTEETNLGNLTADANLAYAKQIDPTVVISLKNGGGIRDNIGVVPSTGGNQAVEKLPPQPNPLAPNKTTGDVSRLDIENSLRFNNALSLVTVTASQLKELLENGVSGVRAGATPGAFPQVSGLKFSFDATKTAQILATDGTITTPGQRIRSLAIVNDQDKIVDVIVENGAVVGNPSRSFRMVTLNFLAGTTPTAGGDGYPFFRFIRENPSLANRIDLTGETTTDLNGNGRIDPAVALPTGKFTFAANGTEQDALAEYLGQIGSYGEKDTAATEDVRIQNLSVRSDAVLSGGRQVNGTRGNNRLSGNVGDDVLVGLGGNDLLRGLGGDDDMDGGTGNDTLNGGGGNDMLKGSRGNDKLLGGTGSDTLDSGIGDDVITCGKGRDVVVLETGKGDDWVRDFRDRQDTFGLTKGLSFGKLTIEQSGRNTLISFRNDLLATLRNVDASDLTKADFRSLT